MTLSSSDELGTRRHVQRSAVLLCVLKTMLCPEQGIADCYVLCRRVMPDCNRAWVGLLVSHGPCHNDLNLLL